MRGDALARVLPHLRDAQKGGRGWMSFCPHHADGEQNRERSLSVGQGVIGALVKCHAGCHTEDVIAHWGLTERDLRDDVEDRPGMITSPVPSGSPDDPTTRERKRIDPSDSEALAAYREKYPIEKVTMRALADHFRLSEEHLRALGLRETKWRGETMDDGTDRLYVEMPDYDERGKVKCKAWRIRVLGKGTKVHSASGATMERRDWRNIPIGLERLAKVRESRSPTLLMGEGRSDAWVLAWHGVPYLMIPGATAQGCLEAEHVAGIRKIFLLRETDEAGHRFVVKTGARLATLGFTGEVRVVRDIPAKDVADLHKNDPEGFRTKLAVALGSAPTLAEYVAEEGGVEGVEIPVAAPSVDVMDRVFSLGSREREEIRFLWYPRIVSGALAILAGDPGIGKGYLVSQIVADMTAGRRLPGETEDRVPSDVLIFPAEDDPASVLRPRIEDGGGDLQRVHCYDLARFPFAFDGDGVRTTRELITKIKPALVVFDPLVTFLGGKVNINNQNEVRSVLQPLIYLTRETGVPFLLVAHTGKGDTPSNVIDAVMGSRDFSAAVRSGMVIMPDPDLEDESESANRNDTDYYAPARGGVLVHAKHNYSAHGASIKYRVVPIPGTRSARFEWGGRCWASVSQLQAQASQARRSPHDRPQLAEAVAILRRELADGPRSVKSLRSRLTAHGVASALLFQARAQAGAVTVDLANGEVGWSLPATDARDEERRRAEVAAAARAAGSQQAEIGGGYGGGREPGVDVDDECPI